MTGPKRMRPESAEADPELTVSYVDEPERRKHGGDICHYLLDESHRECDGVLSRNWGSQPCQPEQQSGVCAKSHGKERFLQ